jgi:16S rRNA (guanine527-N7)-methyltransferase
VKDFSKNVPRETLEKFRVYRELLVKWQKAINLVSRGTLNDVWSCHINDSLQIVPYITARKVLDIGSGAGFPGMILAMIGGFDVICVDSDKRKTIFLEEVARLTKTCVTVINDRVENLTNLDVGVICARGFSNLSNLVEIINSFKSSPIGVFLKGTKVKGEIEDASTLFDFRYELHDVDPSKKIIVINSVTRKNAI